MKLSDQTLKILKNFSSINQSIYIRENRDMIATMSVGKNLVAQAVVEETFPVDFCIYDLPEFLNTLKLFASPILQFIGSDENYMYICEEEDPEFKVRYVFAKKEMIVYPTHKPKLSEVDVAFYMDKGIIDSVMKAANIMQLPNMLVLPEDHNHVRVQVADIKNTSSNVFSNTLQAQVVTSNNFKLVFNMDTFKMLPGNYAVSIQGNRLASFESDNNMAYFIGLDTSSTFTVQQ